MIFFLEMTWFGGRLYAQVFANEQGVKSCIVSKCWERILRRLNMTEKIAIYHGEIPDVGIDGQITILYRADEEKSKTYYTVVFPDESIASLVLNPDTLRWEEDGIETRLAEKCGKIIAAYIEM